MFDICRYYHVLERHLQNTGHVSLLHRLSVNVAPGKGIAADVNTSRLLLRSHDSFALDKQTSYSCADSIIPYVEWPSTPVVGMHLKDQANICYVHPM